MDRRRFSALIAGGLGAALGGCAVRASMSGSPRAVLYASVGARLVCYAVDADAGTLTAGPAVQLPSAVQYAWPHPAAPFLYVAASGAGGHWLCAFRIGAGGALTPHGAPLVLPQRPIHTSVDRAGAYALTCYNSPPNLTVHEIRSDGTLGAPVGQPSGLGLGVYPHQIRAAPSNRLVTLVSRGNPPAAAARPGDVGEPGSIQVFGFDQGRLSPLQTIPPAGEQPRAYGPRHLDFHPHQPWVYLAVEGQNELHMHPLHNDGLEDRPAFVRPTTLAPAQPGRSQVAGAVHVHPRGHVVYVSNRASSTVEVDGRRVFRGGENSIAVFALNPQTGEPSPMQHIDVGGNHPRTFSIDPTGRLLIAADAMAMAVQEGQAIRTIPGGLTLFHIAPDGRLGRAGRIELDLGGEQQLWSGMVALHG
jgi:6-phosphogluconolactonase